MEQRIFHGSTDPEDWIQHSDNENQIYVDVDARHCDFQGIPHYVSSLVGCSHHWSTTGGSSIYLTEKGFRINLRYAVVTLKDGKLEYVPLTIADAKKYKWRINWIAIDSDQIEGDRHPCKKDQDPDPA